MRSRAGTNLSKASSQQRSPSHKRSSTNEDSRSSGHRKTTNDDGRSKSNLRSGSRASGGSSKERVRSKERKSTALSSGSRTGKSQTSTEGEDSEDSDVDVDNVPFHLRRAVPLHLVEARIVKKGEKTEASSPQAIVTEAALLKRRVAQQNVQPEVEGAPREGIYDPAPTEQAIVRTRLLCALILVFLLWCSAMIPLLVVHFLIFFLRLGGETHTANADALFGKLEANMAQELTPALNVVFMLRTQASMGLFNVSEPYESITRSIAGIVQDSKQLEYVQMVGASEHMLVLRPGNLHYVPKDEDGDGFIDRLIEPDQMRGVAKVMSDQACEGTSAFLCFMGGADLLKLQMVPLPSRHVTGSWFGPDFLFRGKDDEVLTEPSEYPFVVRFLGLLNVTEGLPPRRDPNQLDAFGRPLLLPVQIGLDVALNLYRFEDILQEVTPEGGSAYVFFLDGSILAGTGWDPMTVSYFKYESSLEYEKIWELPTEWSQKLTAEDVRSGERFEFYTSNQDLVVVKSLGDTLTQDDALGASAYIGDAMKATSKAALRVLVVVPRDVAVSPMLTMFVDIAMGIVIAPFATGGLVCFIVLTLALVRWCREKCQPVEEEDPYLWKFEDEEE